MFGTIRYDKDTDSREHVQLQRADGIEARGYTPIACDRCRSRKLKCSGDKDGCGRCQTASVACTYRDVFIHQGQQENVQTGVHFEEPVANSEPTSRFQPQPTTAPEHRGGPRASSKMSEVPERNDPSSTDVDNIFDAVLDTEAAYHHTNVPSQPARLNENTPEKRAGRASLPGDNLSSAVGAGKRISSECECLSDVARFLEVIGVESTEARADMLLVCVSRGMRICGKALRCSDCTVRGVNGMFLAVVLQQLVTLTRTTSDKLLAWARENRNCQGSAAENHSPTVWLDQYRIEMPELKVPLIRHVALLHLFSLRDLSNSIKDTVRPNSMARHLITDCESNIVDALEMVQDKASNAMPMGSAF